MKQVTLSWKGYKVKLMICRVRIKILAEIYPQIPLILQLQSTFKLKHHVTVVWKNQPNRIVQILPLLAQWI